MNRQYSEETEIDLVELFFEFLRHIWAILFATIAGALVAGLITVFVLTPMYTSTSQLYIMSKSSMVDLSSLQMSTSLTADYEEMIKTRPVVEQVIENLGLKTSYGELLSHISISNETNTRIIKITVEYDDPVVAKDIANELANVSKEQIAQIMNVDEPRIVEPAIVAKSQSSPNNGKNVVIGALVGLLLALAFFTIRYIMDDTIKNADDIEKYLGLNTLASIPLEGGTDNSEKKSRKKRWHGIQKGAN